MVATPNAPDEVLSTPVPQIGPTDHGSGSLLLIHLSDKLHLTHSLVDVAQLHS